MFVSLGNVVLWFCLYFFLLDTNWYEYICPLVYLNIIFDANDRPCPMLFLCPIQDKCQGNLQSISSLTAPLEVRLSLICHTSFLFKSGAVFWAFPQASWSCYKRQHVEVSHCCFTCISSSLCSLILLGNKSEQDAAVFVFINVRWIIYWTRFFLWIHKQCKGEKNPQIEWSEHGDLAIISFVFMLKN